MDTLADSLQNLDVDGGSTAIVAIVLVCVVMGDAMWSFGCREGECGTSRDARNDVARVKRKYGGVDVDIVWIQDGWEGERFQNGVWKVGRERIFVRTGMRVVIRVGKRGDREDAIPGVSSRLGCGTPSREMREG